MIKRIGNSAAMIERYYSKLTATMAAERLCTPRALSRGLRARVLSD
jgi:hypothetical protein